MSNQRKRCEKIEIKKIYQLTVVPISYFRFLILLVSFLFFYRQLVTALTFAFTDVLEMIVC
jgi:hypothetical protein